jgi:glutaredoxin 3
MTAGSLVPGRAAAGRRWTAGSTIAGRNMEVREIGAVASVEIYTTEWCGFCQRAKALLGRKGVSYREIRAGGDASMRREMIARAEGRSTFPQIFINGVPVGGCDDLHELDASGALDPMLAQPAVEAR